MRDTIAASLLPVKGGPGTVLTLQVRKVRSHYAQQHAQVTELRSRA